MTTTLNHKQKMQLATARIKHLEAVSKAIELGRAFSFVDAPKVVAAMGEAAL
jgi:hypothetical protein